MPTWNSEGLNQAFVFFLCFVIFCGLSAVLYFPSSEITGSYQFLKFNTEISSHISNVTTAELNPPVGFRRMLVWPRRFNAEIHEYDKHPPSWFGGCPESRCVVTSKRTKLRKSDAVLFHMPDTSFNDLPHPFSRKSNQYYIFYNEESPDSTKTLMNWKVWDIRPGFFNLTMTYRSDSDIFSGMYLGGYFPHIINVTEREPLWFAGKRDVLWLVSHCHTVSKREEYVKKLEQFIAIDEIGSCDDRPDPCKLRKCKEPALFSKYKFYLSFENSLCEEYVTEKLVRALNNDVVPVVYGAANYSHLLPAKAVINIEDFDSPKSLADYLKYLIDNETAYEEHLSWKYPGQPLWQLPGVKEKGESSFCRLCEILHLPSHQRINKTYSSIIDWFFNGKCREPVFKLKGNQSLEHPYGKQSKTP